MTIVMFGEKGGGLQAKEHHPNHEARGWQHHVVVVLYCRKNGKSWHHEVGNEVENVWIY